MDLFKRYETDFVEITSSVAERIERIPSLSGSTYSPPPRSFSLLWTGPPVSALTAGLSVCAI
jgi:hypothetical protein